MEFYIIVGIGLVVVALLMMALNNFNKLDSRVDDEFKVMDVYLKKRWDLIPELIDTVKAYASREKETLEEIMKMRNGDYDILDNEEKIKANERVTRGINKIIDLPSKYSKLKNNDRYIKLVEELKTNDIEIIKAKNSYNTTVSVFNDVIGKNILARLFGFKKRMMYEVQS